MKNNFKKADAQGNKLPEEIGKGINEEHLKKVLSEMNPNDSALTLRLPSDLHIQLIDECDRMQVTKSFYVKQLLINHFKYESK